MKIEAKSRLAATEKTLVQSICERVTYEWLKLMPHSTSVTRIAPMSSTTAPEKNSYYMKFYVAKDVSEVANRIMDNDVLSFTIHISPKGEGAEAEGKAVIYGRPDVGSGLAFKAVKMRAFTVTGTEDKVVTGICAQLKKVKEQLQAMHKGNMLDDAKAMSVSSPFTWESKL
jgi:hypothetical protein